MAGKGEITIFKEIANSGLPKIRIQLPTHTIANPREFVLESIGNNQFYPHFRIWDGDHIMGNISSSDKNLLFDKMYDVLPEGAELMVPRSSMDYLATPGTVGAYTRFAGDSRYVAGTPGSFLYRDKDGGIKTFNTTSFFKPRTSHVQGAEAVLMFKDYGGEVWPEGSINGEQLMRYVPEARERYGLVGNADITDEEIARALYKHVKELGGNTAAVNAQGEPQLLFRGDTKAYTELLPRWTPEKLAINSGTMDNSLGTLFLGEFPHSYQGVDRYLGTLLYWNGDISYKPSGTGSEPIEGLDLLAPPKGTYPLYSGLFGRGQRQISVMKLPGSAMKSGVNDLNAFVVRTPAVRDATPEISVLNDDWLAKGAVGATPHMSTKIIEDKDGFPMFLHPDGTTTPALAGDDNRPGMAEHYRFVLDDAKSKNQGLLKSNAGAPLRDEHSDYSYFALPNFNIQGAKHILPYDLRIPRDWNSKNIFRSLALPAIAGAGLTYYINSNGSNDK